MDFIQITESEYEQVTTLLSPSLEFTGNDTLVTRPHGDREAAIELLQQIAVQHGAPALAGGHRYGIDSDRFIVGPDYVRVRATTKATHDAGEKS